MSIVSSKALYDKCIHEPWAIGGFIGYNMEIMQAAVQGAVDVNAPVMIQASCRVVEYAGAKMLRKMAEACSEMYTTNVILHLDHGNSVSLCKHWLDNGFTSVMLECDPTKPLSKHIMETAEVVAYAHAYDAVVEGEVFHSINSIERVWTDVEEARRFTYETQCDSLSISCGIAHGLPSDYHKQLDVDQIRCIHETLPDMPLVLHATSILSPELVERVNRVGGNIRQPENFSLSSLQNSFQYGVTKVNSALDIKYVFSAAIREYMLRYPQNLDPRTYIGYAREAVRHYIADKHEHIFSDSKRMEGQLT